MTDYMNPKGSVIFNGDDDKLKATLPVMEELLFTSVLPLPARSMWKILNVKD